MDKFMCMVAFTTLAMALLRCAAARTVHVVGDNLGWKIPPSGAAAYTNWASGKTFMVGDVLVFNFATNEHDVLQVTKASFDACTSTNALGNPILTGPANVTLTSSGDLYYICTFGRHCQVGQKLAITVSGSPSPTASPIPTPGGPSGSTTRPGNSPPDSSSTTVFTSFIVTLLSIATSFFM